MGWYLKAFDVIYLKNKNDLKLNPATESKSQGCFMEKRLYAIMQNAKTTSKQKYINTQRIVNAIIHVEKEAVSYTAKKIHGIFQYLPYDFSVINRK